MNGIERHFTAFCEHCKQLRWNFSFISLAVLLAISSFALVANAQEEATASSSINNSGASSTAPSSQPAEADVQESEPVADRSQSTLTPRLQTRVTNLAANISNRMDAAIARLSQISGRLERRLEKISTTGTNVSVARNHLTDANESLRAATAILSGIDRLIADVVGSPEPRKAWQTAKVTYQAASTEIRNARQSLLRAVAALKRAEDGNATGVVNEPAAVTNFESNQ